MPEPLLFLPLNIFFSSSDSTFQFLLEQWKEQLPPGYLLKEAFIDPPFEEDACYCHFNFSKDKTDDNDSEVVLKYQWYIGERTPSNFVAIPGATGEVMSFHFFLSGCHSLLIILKYHVLLTP